MIHGKLIGPQPPQSFKGNGCGALGTGILDWVFKHTGLVLDEAWRYHDWAYKLLREGEADFDRQEADQWLMDNIQIIGDWQDKPIRAWLMSWPVYRTVRRLGKYTV